MTVILRLTVALLLFVAGLVPLIALQYLAYHGPDWILWRDAALKAKFVSPILSVPVIVFSIINFIGAIYNSFNVETPFTK